jgi:hypothetical protein
MKRRLLNLLTTLSLVLCLATAVLWPMSYWSYARFDGYQWASVRDRRQGTTMFRSSHETLATVAAGGAQFRTASYQAPERSVVEERTWYQSGRRLSGGGYPLSPSPGPGKIASVTALGFELIVCDYRGPAPTGASVIQNEFSVTLPLWFLVAAFATPPVLWARARRRRRLEAEAGKCPACGYDLRATPGCCPECGTAASVPDEVQT